MFKLTGAVFFVAASICFLATGAHVAGAEGGTVILGFVGAGFTVYGLATERGPNKTR